MSGDDSYKVGYRKPPKRTRFKKGQSGNPTGRPRGSRSLKTFLMAALNETVTIKENGQTKRISKREAATKQIANKAAMGDPKSFKLLVELVGDDERREEQVSSYAHSESAGERFIRKIDEMAARMRTRHGLPPEEK